MHTDRELLIATQIAYYDFSPYVWNSGRGENLRTFLHREKNIGLKLEHKIRKTQQGESELKQYRARRAYALYQNIIQSDSVCGNWIMRYRLDDNSKSGMYACLIETSPESAIIAFRGSESGTRDQVEKDWIQADFGLLQSTLTGQQLVASLLMREIHRKFTYRHYTLTGHSLGGNLCLHAALCAPGPMKAGIDRALSFDGPGFSGSYIKAWRKDILNVSGRLAHYQWSLVGNLLFRIPGEAFRTIAVSDLVADRKDIFGLTQKHDTCFVLFDEKGAVLSGGMDDLARKMGFTSRLLDVSPGFVGGFVQYITRKAL